MLVTLINYIEKKMKSMKMKNEKITDCMNKKLKKGPHNYKTLDPS
jgi:hypothetical protein